MSGQIKALDLTASGTSILFPVGTIHIDPLGRFFQYVKGGGTIAQYEYTKVSSDGLFTATSLTTTTNPSTEPAMVGCYFNNTTSLSSTTYGWVFRGNGAHTGKFAASCVQAVKIYTTATAGVVDDASTTLVNGLLLITTITSATQSPAWAAGLLTSAAA